jgi:hypothetical protein
MQEYEKRMPNAFTNENAVKAHCAKMQVVQRDQISDYGIAAGSEKCILSWKGLEQ